MFFMGTYTPKLDDKGRLFLPAKFRDRLAEGIVVTQGQENCLVVWPTDVFMEEANRARATPMTVKSAREYARVLFAGADEGALDKQGRIGIPANLRDYAGLDKRRRRHRRHGPDRDLGPRPLAGVLHRCPAEVRRARRGAGAATRLHQQPAPTQQHTAHAQGQVSCPPLTASWDHFPGSRRRLPRESGQGPGPADPFRDTAPPVGPRAEGRA